MARGTQHEATEPPPQLRSEMPSNGTRVWGACVVWMRCQDAAGKHTIKKNVKSSKIPVGYVHSVSWDFSVPQGKVRLTSGSIIK